MAASMPDSLEVRVFWSLLAVLFSWMMMVTMSPTPEARLSATIGRAPSFQSDCADAETLHNATSATTLENHDNCTLILDLSFKFAFRTDIAHPDNLTGNAILERLRLYGNGHRLVLHHGIDHASAFDDRAQTQRARGDLRARLNVFAKFNIGIVQWKGGQKIAIVQNVAAFHAEVRVA